VNEELKHLYKEMAELTQPECANNCRCPMTCCSPEYCDMALERARQLGEVLEPTGHHRLPLMGPTGCVAAPHLRPNCTLHTCAVNNLGFKPGDPVWTKRYFKLRDAIEQGETR
jgi:hypothetical protein